MPTLVGVMAALEGPALEEAHRLWKWLEDQYRCRKVYTSQTPHLAFQGGYCDDVAPIERHFDQLAASVVPFDLMIDGIATFEAPVRVIYMRVALTDGLQQRHREIHQFFDAHCQKTLELYHPDHWVPHISLVVEDISEKNFRQALQELPRTHLSYRMTLHNLHLVEVKGSGEPSHLVRSYSSTGQPSAEGR